MSAQAIVDLFLRKEDVFSIPSAVKGNCGRLFELDERIDAGGNGVVYKCVESTTGNEFAAKFLLNYDSQGKRLKRFQFEIDQLSKVKHAHLVKLEANGSVSGTRKRGRRSSIKQLEFFVMELADSGNLRHLSLSDRAVPEEIYKAQFRGLADGLRSLHEHDVVHRDIKPENVLISGETWILADFGLCAPLTRTGQDLTGNENLGPRFWMSPEMSSRCLGIKVPSTKIGKASDVFQLASVFWFIVNKRHPSGNLEQADWRGAAPLFPVLQRAMEHCPKRRTQDGKTFHEQICEALA